MARKLVLQGGVLSAEVVSFEQVELAQLEAEVNTKQSILDGIKAEHEAVVSRLEEAEAALEDSKSEHENGARLVEEAASIAAGESTDESVTDGVHVPVESL